MTDINTIPIIEETAKRPVGRPRKNPPKQPSGRPRGRPKKVDTDPQTPSDTPSNYQRYKEAIIRAHKVYIGRGQLGVAIHRCMRNEDPEGALRTALDVIAPEISEETIKKVLELIIQ